MIEHAYVIFFAFSTDNNSTQAINVSLKNVRYAYFTGAAPTAIHKVPCTHSDMRPVCLSYILSEENLKHFRFSSDSVRNICFSPCLLIEQ